MNINEAFGKVLNDEIAKKRIKKDDFIKESGISRANFFKILSGQHSPSLDTIDMLAKALGMSPGKLISKANGLRKG